MPRRLGEFPGLFRAVSGRVAGRRRRRTAFRTAFRILEYTLHTIYPAPPERVWYRSSTGAYFGPGFAPRLRAAGRPKAGLARSTPPHGTHATWHAANAACNKTELIRLLIST